MASKARILVIDDDVDFIEATKLVLAAGPYDVTVAYEGNEGFRKAKKEKPDLIILDVIMPGKDGFAVAQQLKNDPELREIPLLMLTSFSEKGAYSSIPFSGGLTLEAEDYIDKPVSPEELLKRVSRHLK
jgi:two-component system alkaline phosphatase synthesis response regulator PhoP